MKTHVMMLVLGMGLVSGVAGLSGGCASESVSLDNPIPITSDEYHRMFDAAVAVLRDDGYAVDRQDRRFGVITTHPKIAASMLEPWKDDHQPLEDAVASTTNYQRRVVRVTIERTGESGEERSGEDAGGARSEARTPYELGVEVTLERRRLPERQITSAAVSAMQFRSGTAQVEAESARQVGPDAYWQVVKRDHDVEQALLAQIVRKAVGMVTAPPALVVPEAALRDETSEE